MDGINLIPFLMSCLIGVITTVACIEFLKPVAEHIGLLDRPGGRKTHSHHVPLIGGIAIFIGFCFSLLCLNMSLHDMRGLLAGSFILVLIGVVDDFRELTPRVRLLGQVLAGLILIRWGHLSVDNLGNLFFYGPIHLGLLSTIATLFLVLTLINAINMIDGQDGLAGLVILSEALLLAFWSVQLNQLLSFDLLILLSVVLCGFLSFNIPLPWRRRASVFMGDAGSTFLGFVIAWFAIGLSQVMLSASHHQTGFNPITILWILAYPLFDLLTVVIHRHSRKKSPFAPSRDHLHHLLIESRIKPAWVTYLLFIFSLLMGIIGIILARAHIHEGVQLIIFILLFILYFWFTRILHNKKPRLHAVR